MTFGTDYLIPKPFDPRLSVVIAGAEAQAAMDTSAATKAFEDFNSEKSGLDAAVFKSTLLTRPVFESAHMATRKIVFAEGEDERLLRAAQAVLEEITEWPLLIGRPELILKRWERLILLMRIDRDFNIVNPENDPRYRKYWGTLHNLVARNGVTPDLAKTIMHTNNTTISAVMVHRQDANSMIYGTFGQYWVASELHQAGAECGSKPSS